MQTIWPYESLFTLKTQSLQVQPRQLLPVWYKPPGTACHVQKEIEVTVKPKKQGKSRKWLLHIVPYLAL